ncbi:MAG: hypothetical protein Kow00104_09360 [Rhodothalassiaceae bacterium]
MDALRKYAPYLFSLIIVFVFGQSLFFKFSDAPEPAYIFSTIDTWAAATFGIEGLFRPGGLFSQHVIGAFEGIASFLILIGLFMGGVKGESSAGVKIHALGALLAFGIVSGALFFHLFTPLGIVVGDEASGLAPDGGTLFIMAVAVWISSAMLLFGHRGLLSRAGTAV